MTTPMTQTPNREAMTVRTVVVGTKGPVEATIYEYAPHQTVARRIGPQHFHTKSWSDRFECPTCRAFRRFNLNYLGSKREVVCVNGTLSARAKAEQGTP